MTANKQRARLIAAGWVEDDAGRQRDPYGRGWRTLLDAVADQRAREQHTAAELERCAVALTKLASASHQRADEAELVAPNGGLNDGGQAVAYRDAARLLRERAAALRGG